jgi:phosphatidylglycerophosphatase A
MSFVEIFATWFGCGKAPKAPGTFGTLGAIPLVWAFTLAGPINYLLLSMIFTVVAIFVAHLQELQSGRHDDKSVVIDEVAGLLVTMAWVPFSWTYVILGFALFRLFDIWKPFPISYIDKKIGGGVGCVGDDLVAGILGNIILQVILKQGWIG